MPDDKLNMPELSTKAHVFNTMNNKLKAKFEEMENNRSVLFMMLKDIDEQKQMRKEADSWSITQIVAHLVQSELLTVTYISKKIKSLDSLGKAGFTAVIKSFLLKTMLLLPIKFKAPKILKEVSNDIPINQLEQEWDKVRENLKLILDQLPKDASDKAIFKHPRTGYMNIFQTLEFLQDHFNRHLKQIEKKVLSFN